MPYATWVIEVPPQAVAQLCPVGPCLQHAACRSQPTLLALHNHCSLGPWAHACTGTGRQAFSRWTHNAVTGAQTQNIDKATRHASRHSSGTQVGKTARQINSITAQYMSRAEMNFRHADLFVVSNRAMHSETGRKADQETNLEADVADRPDTDLSNVWVLARQVLHLQSHRQGGHCP